MNKPLLVSNKTEDISGVFGVLHELSTEHKGMFTRWLNSDPGTNSSVSSYSHYSCVIDDVANHQFDHPAWLSRTQRDAIEALVAGAVDQRLGVLVEDLCIFWLAKSEGAAGRLVLIGLSLIRSVVSEIYPSALLTHAELRTLVQLTVGLSLKEAALEDQLGYETKRSQLKSVFAKTGTQRQPDITAVLLSHLLINFGSESYRADSTRLHSAFYQYHKECLPEKVRCHVVVSEDGSQTRLLDFGKADGKPIISPHHLGIMHITGEEIELVEALGLRIIIPLRNGALGPLDEPLPLEDHMRHAMTGISLAQTLFCGESVDLLCPLSACFYGLEYARRFPARVNSLIFAGASYRSVDKISPAHQFRQYLRKMTMSNRWMLNRVLSYLAQQTSDPAVIRNMFLRAHADCPYDLKVIDTEFDDPDTAYAFEFRIRHSLLSIQHDLYQQVAQDWSGLDQINSHFHFIHGANNQLHPLRGVERLARDLPHATVYPIARCGSMIYHHNTPVFFRIVKEIVDA